MRKIFLFVVFMTMILLVSVSQFLMAEEIISSFFQNKHGEYISRFFLGIIIRMFYDEHNPPHFHVEYLR